MHLAAHKVGTPNIQIWDKKKGQKHSLKICKIYTFFMLMKCTKCCWVYLKCKNYTKNNIFGFNYRLNIMGIDY